MPVEIYGTTGSDVLTGTAAEEIIHGGPNPATNPGFDVGNDTINGGDGADTLYGEGGNDVLTAGTHVGNQPYYYVSDWLYGGAGDDVLNASHKSDTNMVGGPGNDVLNGHGQAGFSIARYDNASGPVSVSLNITGPQNTGSDGIDTLHDIHDLVGSQYNDILIGGPDTTYLKGNGGDDMLFAIVGTGPQAGGELLQGGNGNDQLYGSIDDDGFEGGNGIDTALFGNALSGVTVRLDGFGLDEYGRQNTIGAGRDRLELVENLTGTAYNDVLIGSNEANALDGAVGNDQLFGGGGNDILYGRAGNDTLQGGSGNDTASYISAAAAITANLGNGTSSGGAGADQLVDIENLTGSSFNDTLIGHAGANTLDGSTGYDSLTGGDGNDTYHLFSLARNGIGIDSYDIVNENGTGVDTIRVRPVAGNLISAYQLGPSIEFGRIDGPGAFTLIGNALANELSGNDESNALDGREGADTLFGGSGHDLYLNPLGDTIMEGVDRGHDTVRSDASFSLVTVANVERLELTGDVPGFARGNSLANVLVGNSGSNTIEGMAGDDVVFAVGGRDTVTGGAGRDEIHPGIETDTLRFTAVSDSTGARRDLVTDWRFGLEKLDFTLTPTALNASVTTGTLNESAFAVDLAAAIAAAQLGANRAVLFDPSAGDLDIAGRVFLIVDANGVAGYQDGGDYVVEFVSPTGTLTLADFI